MNKDMDKYNDEQYEKLIHLALKWGWNGIENSKIISEFYSNLLQDLRDRVIILDAQLTKAKKSEDELSRRVYPDTTGQ